MLMPLTNPLFWQSLSFSSAAVLIVVLSIWWLYWSPLRAEAAQVAAPSTRLAGGLAALLGLSAMQFVIGALWDGSMHILTGEIPAGADFLWPPHIMLYGAFFISLVVAVTAVGIVGLPGWRAGERDPRLWVRRNPYLGAVALASLYSLLALPGDALWHALFGIDLTAWSPPHILIAGMMCTVMICAVGVLVQSRPALPQLSWVDIAIPILLGLMLNAAIIIGTVEWEFPDVRSPLVEARPIWFYPLVGGGLAFFTLVLAKRLARFRSAAMATAAVFYLVRLVVTAGLRLTGNLAPHVPPLFVLGAFLLDAVPWQLIKSNLVGDLGLAAAFTTGYSLLALPMMMGRRDLRDFTRSDVLLAVASTLALSLALVPVVRLVGARLLGQEKTVASYKSEAQ